MPRLYFRRHLRVLSISFALLFSGALHAQENPPDLDYPALVQAIDAVTDKLKHIRGAVDQTRFDPDAWLGSLDYEDTEILRAVQENIEFQPYAGTLRGVSGTLRARAGNSLDQSLLLAYLLKSAGYDARIARGALSEVDSRRLLSTMSGTAPEESMAYLEAPVKAQFGPQAVREMNEPDLQRSGFAKRSVEAGTALLETLGRVGIDLELQEISSELQALMGDYFWVQYREGPARAWTDAHPAFGAERAPADLAALQYFAEAIPEEYQHRLTISAWLNQRRGDSITTHALMTPYTRPVANLHGVALSYRNHPAGLDHNSLENLGEVVANARLFIPMFNEALAPGAMAFDLKGRVIDPMALTGGGAGFFATLADRMEKATASVADPDDPGAVFGLESMWLEFTFTSPSGTEKRFRRYILPGDSDGDTHFPEQRIWPLITDHTYMVNSGRQPLDYLADRYLATGIVGNEWYKALVHKFTYPDQGTALPRDDMPRDFGLLSQYQFMDAGPQSEGPGTAIRTQPSLVGVRRGFVNAAVAFLAIDIVANATLHIRAEDGKLFQDPRAALRRGVWDTSVEGVAAKTTNLEIIRSANALEVFQQAREQGIELRVIRPGQKLSGEPVVGRAMLEDLENGYIVIVPARKPRGAQMNAWWRVSAATGETLGMTADGYGQDAVEYMIQNTGIAFGLIQALQSFQDCYSKHEKSVVRMCCLVEAHINNVGGLAFGGYLGAMLGTAGSALFTIVDYGTQLATEAALKKKQGLMPTAALNCERLPATDW